MTPKQKASIGVVASIILGAAIISNKSSSTQDGPPLPPGFVAPTTIAQRIDTPYVPVTNIVHMDLYHNVYLEQSYFPDGPWSNVPVTETYYGLYNHVTFTNSYTNQCFFRTYVK